MASYDTLTSKSKINLDFKLFHKCFKALKLWCSIGKSITKVYIEMVKAVSNTLKLIL